MYFIVRVHYGNYRGATHSQVVQLLLSSGPVSTFIVSSPFTTFGSVRGAVSSTDFNNVKSNIATFKDKVSIIIIFLYYYTLIGVDEGGAS